MSKLHPLNKPEVISFDFFEKPSASSSKRIEHIYNKIYGTLPTLLNFSEEFERTCLQPIEKYFDAFCADITKVKDISLEEGFWLGKKDTSYENVFLQVNFRLPNSGANMPIASLLDFEEDKQKCAENLYVSIKVAAASKESAYAVHELLKEHTIQDKSKIYMLTNSYGELNFTALPLEVKKADLALNYGESFLAFHEKLITTLNETVSGLYLFYGEPGTGKSSYIKHLLTGELQRKVAYIPVGLIGQLVSPDMLPLLMENKDTILVIEDAEKALLSRESDEGSPTLVSALLNLTDGFIGQSLNITVIATFNTSRDNIDKALLRKGRLKMSYDFKKLSERDAKKLAEHLGKDPDEIQGDTTLADIYHLDEDTGFKQKEVRRVGFN
jgi:hypothetical protein